MTHDEDRSSAMAAASTMNRLIRKGTVVSVKEAADQLGYTPQAIQKMLAQDRITDLSIGHAHFVLQDDIDDCLKTRDGNHVTE